MTDSSDDLRMKVEALTERRVELAHQLSGPYQDEIIEKLAAIQISISAIEAVIASGKKRVRTKAEQRVSLT